MINLFGRSNMEIRAQLIYYGAINKRKKQKANMYKLLSKETIICTKNGFEGLSEQLSHRLPEEMTITDASSKEKIVFGWGGLKAELTAQLRNYGTLGFNQLSNDDFKNLISCLNRYFDLQYSRDTSSKVLCTCSSLELFSGRYSSECSYHGLVR